jgi:hypothetical protein
VLGEYPQPVVVNKDRSNSGNLVVLGGQLQEVGRLLVRIVGIPEYPQGSLSILEINFISIGNIYRRLGEGNLLLAVVNRDDCQGVYFLNIGALSVNINYHPCL